jgi:hypothetical protein
MIKGLILIVLASMSLFGAISEYPNWDTMFGPLPSQKPIIKVWVLRLICVLLFTVLFTIINSMIK